MDISESSTKDVVTHKMKADVKSYAGEFCPSSWRQSPIPDDVEAAISTIEHAVNTYDIVVMKMVGWPACVQAAQMLQEHKDNHKDQKFTQENIVGTSPEMRAALKIAASVPLVSFPSVFIRGQYVGAFDEFTKIMNDGKLPGLLEMPAVDFKSGQAAWSEELKASTQPKFFEVPQNGRWYCFQMHTYANLIRGISALHVIIFLVLLALEGTNSESARDAVMWYFLIDLCLYTVFGPIPWSPLGCLTNLVLWKYRGSSITTIPYKCVFAFYIFSMAQNLFGHPTSAQRAASWSSLALNSGLLAFFRFWPGSLAAGAVIKMYEYMMLLCGCGPKEEPRDTVKVEAAKFLLEEQKM